MCVVSGKASTDNCCINNLARATLDPAQLQRSARCAILLYDDTAREALITPAESCNVSGRYTAVLSPDGCTLVPFWRERVRTRYAHLHASAHQTAVYRYILAFREYEEVSLKVYPLKALGACSVPPNIAPHAALCPRAIRSIPDNKACILVPGMYQTAVRSSRKRCCLRYRCCFENRAII